MKFYNRESEVSELKRIQNLAFTVRSYMTVVTGRRRIGKTSLIKRAFEGTPTLYFFVSRRSEQVLCGEYSEQVRAVLDEDIPGTIATFDVLFKALLEIATRKKFNLVIDEFQEFFNINASVYSQMQDFWDSYREKTHMNLVLSGSVYSLMHKIFHDYNEPLFGRADNIMKLYPFTTEVLKKIMHDYHPGYTNDDLLALYAFTGGVPKYVEAFCDNQVPLKVKDMIAFMFRSNSPYVEEGKTLLIEEFGKNYGLYFSILSAISGGINTQPEIEAALGNKSLGGHIKRLIEDYDVIKRVRPIGSKEGVQRVRYEITDPFLRFWFNYFDRYRSLIELRNFNVLEKIVKADYPTYSGHLLERYFKQKLMESGEYREIGSYWESGKDKNPCEIDIVALKVDGKKAVAVEIKRQRKAYKPALFAEKVRHLREKVYPKYEVEPRCLSLEDM
ncbi:MAG: ATP-binding protein [Bacteroides sp.]|nr:ATP-binding protein [Ruminococcus flavefaciens]MCM1554007.1 ATP-binding protein [Bacteroides sp.]